MPNFLLKFMEQMNKIDDLYLTLFIGVVVYQCTIINVIDSGEFGALLLSMAYAVMNTSAAS